MKSIYLTLLALFLVIGCGPKDPATAEAGKTGTTGTTPPEAGTTATTAGTTGEEPKTPELPKLPLSDVPAAAKTDAYEYYGLGNEKTMSVELKSKTVATKTGGVSVNLNKVDGGKAFFTVSRTGGISEDLGNDTVMADSTGIYMAGTSIGTVSPSSFLALPADLKPGKSWPQKTKVVRNDGQEISEDSIYKVVGVQDLKTKSGTKKALLVTSTGTAVVSLGGQKETAKYETKSWYVKGVGPVKIEISLTSKGKPTQTLTVEQSD